MIIKLDVKKLLGFRLMDDAKMGGKLGGKVGLKSGFKGGRRAVAPGK